MGFAIQAETGTTIRVTITRVRESNDNWFFGPLGWRPRDRLLQSG
jgi:hypothetical protein